MSTKLEAPIRAVCFDWGGTLMADDGPDGVPMSQWPEVSAVPGAHECLTALHGRVPLCIATNAAQSSRGMIEAALDRVDLLRFINEIFCFTEIGFKKDRPEFWRAVRRRLAVPVNQIVMVGDSFEDDVLTPRKIGLQAVWFTPGDSRLGASADPVAMVCAASVSAMYGAFCRCAVRRRRKRPTCPSWSPVDEEDRMDLKTLAVLAPWDWPKETGQVLLDALRDDGLAPSDRLIAAELAGNFVVVNDELAAELASIVANGEASDELRARAVIALGPALESGDTDGFDEDYGAPISERCFLETAEALRELFQDTELSKEVRRRILEASVRAPQDWHRQAIREAYASADDDWKLTAVFAMEFVQGFDDEILDALGSENDEIEYQAVCAAGARGLDAAWRHVSGIVASGCLDKELLLAAIEAVPSIRPEEAGMVLVDLIDHDDEDVVMAAHDAMAMANVLTGLDVDDEFDEDDIF